MGLEWNRKVEPLNRNVFPTNLSIGLGSEPFKGRMLEFYWPRALSSTCHAKVTIRPSLHCSQLHLFTLNSLTGRLLANLKLLKWPSDSLGPSATTKIDRTPARSLGTYRLRRICFRFMFSVYVVAFASTRCRTGETKHSRSKTIKIQILTPVNKTFRNR